MRWVVSTTSTTLRCLSMANPQAMWTLVKKMMLVLWLFGMPKLVSLMDTEYKTHRILQRKSIWHIAHQITCIKTYFEYMKKWFFQIDIRCTLNQQCGNFTALYLWNMFLCYPVLPLHVNANICLKMSDLQIVSTSLMHYECWINVNS